MVVYPELPTPPVFFVPVVQPEPVALPSTLEISGGITKNETRSTIIQSACHMICAPIFLLLLMLRCCINVCFNALQLIVNVLSRPAVRRCLRRRMRTSSHSLLQDFEAIRAFRTSSLRDSHYE